MVDETYESLKARIADALNPGKKEFARCVAEISRNFRDLGLETAVWHPKRIHCANVGGLDADSYIGYSRIEGRWGLIIRTIEREQESHAFVNQRVYAIESCSNVEIVVSALKAARELLAQVAKTADQEKEMLAKVRGEFDDLRNPGFRF